MERCTGICYCIGIRRCKQVRFKAGLNTPGCCRHSSSPPSSTWRSCAGSPEGRAARARQPRSGLTIESGVTCRASFQTLKAPSAPPVSSRTSGGKGQVSNVKCCNINTSVFHQINLFSAGAKSSSCTCSTTTCSRKCGNAEVGDLCLPIWRGPLPLSVCRCAWTFITAI